MNMALTQAYGYTVRTPLIDNTTLDATHIDSNTSYTYIPTPIQTHQTTTILNTKPHNRKWNPKDFVYTEGSQVKENKTPGAGVVNPRTQNVTHVDIKSQKQRNTFNRAELAAIALALRRKITEGHLKILTDSSFCINTIRNYRKDSASYKNHLHKYLLNLTDKLVRARDIKQLKTHVGKVKSHTGIEYNEAVDKAAK